MDKFRGVTASTAPVRATRLNCGGSKAAKSTHCITYIVLTVLPDSLHLTKLFCVQSILAALHSLAPALTLFYSIMRCTVLHSNTSLLCHALYLTVLFYSIMRCTVLHSNTSLLCHALYLTVFIVLHCTALYYTALPCTALYCTVLHCTALYCTVQYCLYCIAFYCTIFNYTTLDCTLWRFTVGY
jgi:hypothetical protein